jgi:hypothetical protein
MTSSPPQSLIANVRGEREVFPITAAIGGRPTVHAPPD